MSYTPCHSAEQFNWVWNHKNLRFWGINQYQYFAIQRKIYLFWHTAYLISFPFQAARNSASLCPLTSKDLLHFINISSPTAYLKFYIKKSDSSSMSEQLQRDLEALLNGPAGTPPAGIQPNFDQPANLNTVIYITNTITLILATLAVFIRIYTRHFLLRSMGYDDCEFRYCRRFLLKYSDTFKDTSVLAWVDLYTIMKC